MASCTKLVPPSGSISTFINLLPVAQLVVTRLPVTAVAPALPTTMLNKPRLLVVTALVSLYTVVPVVLPSKILKRTFIFWLGIPCPMLLRATAW